MHASIQELIRLRDGGPSDVDIAQHVASCEFCHAELTRLTRLRQDLRQLPALTPPHTAWRAINEKVQLPAPAVRHTWLPRAAVALSALLILTVPWTSALWQRFSSVGDKAQVSAQVGQGVERLVARSQQLEALLQALPQRPAVERAATSAAIDELQTRIQGLDLQLSAAQELGLDHQQTQLLWNERVQLLNSLVGVRYAEAARSYRPVNSTSTLAI